MHLGNGELCCALRVWSSTLRASGTKRLSGSVGIFAEPDGAGRAITTAAQLAILPFKY